MNVIMSKEKVNWKVGKSPKIFEKIHEEQINIAIYERNVNHLTNEIKKILTNELNFSNW